MAHYAAVLFGTSTILWMCRVITGRHALVAVGAATIALLGTHTRTALLGALIGVGLASASLFLGHARVRRVSVSTIVGMIAAHGDLRPADRHLAGTGSDRRGRGAAHRGGPRSGPTCSPTPRPAIESVFGSGLSNKSFDGLAIDSNWVASYLDQGWFGIVLQAAMLLLLLAMVATHVRGPRRAVALFLIVYVLVSSITETGIGDASPYILDLVVAASLLSSATSESMLTEGLRSSRDTRGQRDDRAHPQEMHRGDTATAGKRDSPRRTVGSGVPRPRPPGRGARLPYRMATSTACRGPAVPV